MTDSEVRIRDALLIALTFAAGVVDAVSYLGLGAIFTANMTGNTVLLALAVSQRHQFQAFRSLDALLGFSFGAFLAGRVLAKVKDASVWPRRVTWVLGLELVALVVFSLLWFAISGTPSGNLVYVLIGLSSIAMGAQAAGARHFALSGVTTTVLTTALAALMAELAAIGVAGSDERRWTAIVLGLFAGATLGGTMILVARVWAPILATATVAGVCAVAVMRFRPVEKIPESPIATTRAS
ncbi:MAG: YoaK family protein [Thermoplasmata archaeon]